MALMKRDVFRGVALLREIPTLPRMMTRILEVVEDSDSSAADLTDLIATDPVIASRILRVANSAFYGARHQVDSVHRAVVVLGFDAVRDLALATSVIGLFDGRRQSALDPDAFWLHGLGAAKAAQLLAQRCPLVSNPDSCFTAGLLHDIGKLALALSLGPSYRIVVDRAAHAQEPLTLAEERELGVNHAETGAWLAERWGLPPIIADCIRHLYHPNAHHGPFQLEVQAVALGHELARAAGYPDPAEAEPPRIDHLLCPDRGLTLELAADVSEALAALHADARRLYDLVNGEGAGA